VISDVVRYRLQGWWGHNKDTRFSMPTEFSPLPGAAGWQFSNPSVLDVVSLLSSLQLFRKASQVLPRASRGGNISQPYGPILGSLREKSVDLTGYLEILLSSSPHYVPAAEFSAVFAAREAQNPLRPTFTIITPSNPERRGAQLSLLFSPVSTMDDIFEQLRSRGILGDERRPGVIRFAPVPMYCSWGDVQEAAAGLEEVLGEYALLREEGNEVEQEGQAVEADLKEVRSENVGVRT
jgi:kynureninase